MPELLNAAREAGLVARVALLAAGLAVLIAVIGALASLTVTIRETHHNRRLINEIKTLGAARREVIHTEDVRICRANHTLYVLLNEAERKALTKTEVLIHSGAYDRLDPRLKRAALGELLDAERFLVKLKKVDCTSVPNLNGTGQRTPVKS